MLNKKEDKDRSSIICYECKKLGHLRSKCPKLEKSQDKKKHYKTKEKKGLMRTREDLDDTSSDEDEEDNLCLITDTTSKESESDQKNKVNLDDLESLKKAYHELLSNSSILSKACKKIVKRFKKLVQSSYGT